MNSEPLQVVFRQVIAKKQAAQPEIVFFTILLFDIHIFFLIVGSSLCCEITAQLKNEETMAVHQTTHSAPLLPGNGAAFVKFMVSVGDSRSCVTTRHPEISEFVISRMDNISLNTEGAAVPCAAVQPLHHCKNSMRSPELGHIRKSDKGRLTHMGVQHIAPREFRARKALTVLRNVKCGQEGDPSMQSKLTMPMYMQ